MENPLQSAMMEAVASRIRNRENPENAAVTETIVQDWRYDVTDSVARALKSNEVDRLEALSPAGKTLSPDQETKINETYDEIRDLYKAVLRPIKR